MDWLRKWDWDVSVERHRKALCWIMMTLFAIAGLVTGAVIETLPRHVHLSILRRLRPTEAAVRRLIVLVMRAAEAGSLPFVWKRREPKRRKKGGPRESRTGDAKAVPAFPLFDPRKYVGPPKQKTVPGYGPRIWAFDGFDDPAFIRKTPMPDDPVPAFRLCQRLLTLKAAMDDLPAQAARLKRALARATRKWPEPMRRGRPPGHRADGKELIDEILEDCQIQAIWAFVPLKPG